ncbi:hypothetical protein EW146_g910 [Bondarzewia mesenterica]|uniref:Enoyl reductase (ER) domain-containing protein n=1 Tax=Bondarzewia mesenterica TaxID=1095465 RepID=A0A4S4M606_9AGAM|nr:hypothetical protein EW146_g910 [Bondarzewia mesenterica]
MLTATAAAPPDDWQKRIFAYSKIQHQQYHRRGHFRPWGLITYHEPTLAYRFVYPILLSAGRLHAYLYDVRSEELVQTIDEAITTDMQIEYVDLSEPHVFVCHQKGVRVFSREDGMLVMELSENDRDQCVHMTIEDPPPSARGPVFMSPVVPRENSASTFSIEPFEGFVAVHVSADGRDLAVLCRTYVMLIKDYERIIRGVASLADAVSVKALARITRSSMEELTAINFMQTEGFYVFIPGGSYCGLCPARTSTISPFPDLYIFSILPLEQGGFDDDFSCLQMTDRRIFCTWNTSLVPPGLTLYEGSEDIRPKRGEDAEPPLEMEVPGDYASCPGVPYRCSQGIGQLRVFQQALSAMLSILRPFGARMAPITVGRTIYKEIPLGYPEPGKTTVHDVSKMIDLENEPLNGGFLVKTLVLSIDPYLRGGMRDPKIPSYSPAFITGESLYNFGVGVILRSEHAGLKKGDHVYGVLPFEEYFVRDDPSQFQVIANEEGLPWSVYVGTLGMPGETAYMGWNEFAKAKKGETVFVTAAAGPVGSFVVQIAKLGGLKVIASAGSDEKVAFVRSIGADVVFNYKTESTENVLRREGGIDIYWDNVGGETLDLALAYAHTHARFIECGMISDYNSEGYTTFKNILQIFAKELSLNGFLWSTYIAKYKTQFSVEAPRWVREGKVKFREDVVRGLEQAGQALLDVQKGRNKGKKVVLVAEE